MEKLLYLTTQKMLKYLSARIKFENGDSETAELKLSEDSENNVKYVFAGGSHALNIALGARLSDSTAILSINAESETPFASTDAVSFDLSFEDIGEIDGISDNYTDKIWWTIGKSCRMLSEISDNTQSMLIKCGSLHFFLLGLVSDTFRCEADKDGLHLRIRCGSQTKLSGDFLSVTASTSAVSAVKNCYEASRLGGAIKVPLKEERIIPSIFSDFGWCSWNAFYNEVTSEKIYKKLDEFKEKNIPVKWIIIDAGWSDIRDNKLFAFEEDKNKFPEGLKQCIKNIKENYGVKYVGVWHAFNGYWEGIHPESPLAEEFSDNLYRTKKGMIIPSPYGLDAYEFWHAWHSYLAGCGVDFLKVDNQSSTINILEGSLPTTAGAAAMHRSIEKSISENFGGIVIDCMGMDMENVFARPMSAVSRNSDDFFPDLENGFRKHIVQNCSNALWHSRMYNCDYDMWWSEHKSAVQSGVLRALSGGPIYVSDKIGESNRDNIMPVCKDDGKIAKLDGNAIPTSDCIYHDFMSDENDRLYKIQNRSGNDFVSAVFNLSNRTLTDRLCLDTIDGLRTDIEYVCYEYFSKKFFRVNFSDELELTLTENGAACYTLLPIIHPDNSTDEGAYILIGDTSKYICTGWMEKHRKFISEIEFQ